jgi:hypothetical protein
LSGTSTSSSPSIPRSRRQSATSTSRAGRSTASGRHTSSPSSSTAAPYHIAVRDIEKDKFKDAKLLVIGIRTLRITDTRFNHDRQGVYEDLVAALGL